MALTYDYSIQDYNPATGIMMFANIRTFDSGDPGTTITEWLNFPLYLPPNSSGRVPTGAAFDAYVKLKLDWLMLGQAGGVYTSTADWIAQVTAANLALVNGLPVNYMGVLPKFTAWNAAPYTVPSGILVKLVPDRVNGSLGGDTFNRSTMIYYHYLDGAPDQVTVPPEDSPFDYVGLYTGTVYQPANYSSLITNEYLAGPMGFDLGNISNSTLFFVTPVIAAQSVIDTVQVEVAGLTPTPWTDEPNPPAEVLAQFPNAMTFNSQVAPYRELYIGHEPITSYIDEYYAVFGYS